MLLQGGCGLAYCSRDCGGVGGILHGASACGDSAERSWFSKHGRDYAASISKPAEWIVAALGEDSGICGGACGEMTFPIYDAHNHLQDARLPDQAVVAELEELPIMKAVVNGTRPEDWVAVGELAHKYKWVIPSYGLHPWYVNQTCEKWREQLELLLRKQTAGVGEIGLDRWIEDFDSAKQEEAFVWQLRLAAKLGRPVTIHCLKAFGRLLEILQSEKLPAGFLLHSYGGPAEMIPRFAELGGYFSISGYFSQERRDKQREVFRRVPLDRILVETDAPDMALPAERDRYNLRTENGGIINHPANIIVVYKLAAGLYKIPLEGFAMQIEQNFRRFFSAVLR